MNTEEIVKKGSELIVTYGTKLIGAVLVWIVGSWVIKQLTKQISKILDARDIDASLKPFFKSTAKTVLRVLLVISVLSMLGIEMTSFVAILGAASLAVGMALSGTLQNFAGGVMILTFKPFQVGDYISAQGHEGVVKEIQIFNTILTTPDNKRIIIPNGGLSNSSMTNFSVEPLRRVDRTVGVAYGTDVQKARDIILNICAANDLVLNEPAPVFVKVSELADSSVNIAVRVWTKTENYWDVYFSFYESVYNAFNEAGIGIPFPQMDVHIQK